MFNFLVLAFLAFVAPAHAQNVTCATRPVNDSSNACASTAFTNQQINTLSSPLVLTNYPGVDPTGAGYSDSGFALWLADMKAQRRRGFIPPGNYKFQNQLVVDLNGWTPYAFNIDCGGFYDVILDVSNATVSPQAIFKVSGGTPSAPANQFFGNLNRCTFLTDTRNVTSGTGRIGVSIGMPDISDAFNGNHWDMHVINLDNVNSTAVATQLNGNYASTFYIVSNGGGYPKKSTAGSANVTNGSASVTGVGTSWQTLGLVNGDFIALGGTWYRILSVASNTALTLQTTYSGCASCSVSVETRGMPAGSALLVHSTTFSTIQGAFGQADKGIYLTSGYSFGNSFLNLDLEEVSYCLVNNSANAARNVFVGGQWSYTLGCVNATAGDQNQILSGNDAPAYGMPSNFFVAQTGFTRNQGNIIYPQPVLDLSGNPIAGEITQSGAIPQTRNLTANGKTYQDSVATDGTSYHTNYTGPGIYDNHTVQAGSCFGWFVGSTMIESVCGANHQFMIPARLATFSYVNRPACAANVAGSLIYMTDSNSNVFNASITGSGANKVMALCDGTNWTVH